MAITVKGVGTWAEGTGDVTAPLPTGGGAPAAGDRIYVFSAWKPFSNTAVVSGYTEITEIADGSVASSANAGSVKVGSWWKNAAGGDANPLVDYSGTQSPAIAVAIVLQKGASDSWDAPLFVTGTIAVATSWTSTSTATLTVKDGAMILELSGIRNDSATFTRSATTALSDDGSPAVTWNGNVVEPQNHYLTTASNDLTADLIYRLVTTGAAGVNLTGTGTLSASETGMNLWVHQGVTVAATTASDAFGRSVTDGWGSADVGGAYTLSGTAANFDVDGAAGTISTAASNLRAAYLPGFSRADIEAEVKVKLATAPSANAVYTYLSFRQNAMNDEYMGVIEWVSDGTIRGNIVKRVATAETDVTSLSAVNFGSLTYAAGDWLWLKVRATGASPTTVSIKIWKDGTSEPGSWQQSTTDSSAALQVAGAAGVMTYTGSSVPNGPIVQSFDSFAAAGISGSGTISQASSEVATGAKDVAGAGTIDQAVTMAASGVAGGSGGGAIAYVAERAAYGTGSSLSAHPVPLSSPTAIAVGDHLIARVVTTNSARTVTSISDPRGNVWQIDRDDGNSSGNHYGAVASVKVATAYQAGDSITFNLASSGVAAVVIEEFSGLHATAWVDQINSAEQSTSVTTFSTGSVTTTQAVDLIYGAVVTSNSATISPTAESATPTAWTALTQLASVSTVRYVGGGYRIVAATETVDYDGTLGTARSNVGIIVAYKAAAGGGGGPALSGSGTLDQPVTMAASGVVGGATVASDTFTRSVTDGWGSADVGGAYTLAGTAANFDVDGSKGTLNVTTLNSGRSAVLASVSAIDTDQKVRLTFGPSVTGTGGGVHAALISRYVDAANQYLTRLEVQTGGAMRIYTRQRVADVETTILTLVTLGLTYDPAKTYWFRVQTEGTSPTTVRAKVWEDGTSEPGTWDYGDATDSASVLQVAGGVGFRALLGSAVTNTLPYPFTFDDWNVTSGGGPPALSGSGSISQASSDAATGVKGAVGTGTMVVVESDVATGAKGGVGVGTMSVTSSTPASGVKGAVNTGAFSHGHTMTASGVKGGVGVGSFSHATDITGTGTKQGIGVGVISQTHSMTYAQVKAASGIGTMSQPSTMTSATTSARAAVAEISTTTSTPATGAKGAVGLATTSATIGMTASGSAIESHAGAGSVSVVVGLTATGIKSSSAAATWPTTVGMTASGTALEFHSGTGAVSQAHTAVATGTKAAAAAVADSTTVGMTASGSGATSTTGTGSMTVVVGMVASGVAGLAGVGSVTQGYSMTYDAAKQSFATAATSVTSSTTASGASGRAASVQTTLTAGMTATGVAGRADAGVVALTAGMTATAVHGGAGVGSMTVLVGMTTGQGKVGTATMSVSTSTDAVGVKLAAGAAIWSAVSGISGVGAKGAASDVSATVVTGITGSGVAGHPGSATIEVGVLMSYAAAGGHAGAAATFVGVGMVASGRAGGRPRGTTSPRDVGPTNGRVRGGTDVRSVGTTIGRERGATATRS